jgi:hypothetical protein
MFTSVVVTLLLSSEGAEVTQQKALAWMTGLSAATVSAVVAGLAYALNRQLAFRSATIEAQKMLLEINKQYVAHPTLLHLEDEYEGSVDPTDTDFHARLKAMAYLKLNVFEVIFAVLPKGKEKDTWVNYFQSSLTRCGVLDGELRKYRHIYHPALIKAYDDWKRNP